MLKRGKGRLCPFSRSAFLQSESTILCETISMLPLAFHDDPLMHADDLVGVL